jgi:hypothetical protein
MAGLRGKYGPPAGVTRTYNLESMIARDNTRERVPFPSLTDCAPRLRTVTSRPGFASAGPPGSRQSLTVADGGGDAEWDAPEVVTTSSVAILRPKPRKAYGVKDERRTRAAEQVSLSEVAQFEGRWRECGDVIESRDG